METDNPGNVKDGELDAHTRALEIMEGELR